MYDIIERNNTESNRIKKIKIYREMEGSSWNRYRVAGLGGRYHGR